MEIIISQIFSIGVVYLASYACINYFNAALYKRKYNAHLT